MEKTRKYIVPVWLTIWTLVCIVISLTCKGVGDAGDGVVHYTLARYAFRDPKNFLDMWAKPVFVLLSAPFAQFGYPGIKIFNTLTAALTLWYTYKIAQALKIRYAETAVLILSFCTYYFVLIFSGLTEHLFALFTVLSVWFLLKEKWITASVVLSFLPFVRSEGLIIMGALALYYVFCSKWKYIPLLATGHIVYTLVGYFYFHDWLWIIHKNPYPLNASYGKGPIWHFAAKLYYVTGLVNEIFFALGCLAALWALPNIRKEEWTKRWLLVYLPYGAYFAAHSIFWHFEIYHSMGLLRVLNAVMPLLAIIGAIGFSFLLEMIRKEKSRRMAYISLVALILLFPFSGTPSVIRWKRDLSATEEQRQVMDMIAFMNTHYPGYYVYYQHPLIPFYLDRYYQDNEYIAQLPDYFDKQLRPNSLLIWDRHFAPIEVNVPQSRVDTQEQLRFIREWKTADGSSVFRLYEVLYPGQ